MRQALVYLLSILVMLLCIPMGVSLIYALMDGGLKSSDSIAFILSIALGLTVGYYNYSRLSSADLTEDLRPTDAFFIVTLTWVVSALFGALPYLLYGWVEQQGCGYLGLASQSLLGSEFCSVTNAFFESMSGFTTTGATIIERGLWDTYEGGQGYLSDGSLGLPRSIMLWRSVTHLLGGMGIVVLGVAILPILGVGGMQLYHAEVPGPMNEQFAPRVGEGAKLLWKIYGVMTCILAILYWVAGMDHFEALCHSMSTMATGGFSTRSGSLAGFNSPLLEWISILFMFLAGINFTLYTLVPERWSALTKNSELKTYFFITLIATLLITLSLSAYPSLPGAQAPLRTAAFQVLSILTTTGYASADFELWGGAPLALFTMVCLMFVGGCAGSTGGGIKVIRLLLVFRLCMREFFFLLHPTGKKSIRNDGEVVSQSILRAIVGFIGLYIILLFIGSLCFVIEGQDISTAMTASAASLGNIGPGLSEVGPTDDFACLSTTGKWVSVTLMLMGRLEILTVILLFSPAYWGVWSMNRRSS